MASPARLALALLAVLVAAPAVLATFTTVTGYVYCDVDKSNSVDIPPDTPAKGAQVKIVCIVAPPNNTSVSPFAATSQAGTLLSNVCCADACLVHFLLRLKEACRVRLSAACSCSSARRAVTRDSLQAINNLTVRPWRHCVQTKYAFADADGMYTFNMTIPTFNSTRGLFGGCIASLVNQPNTTCAKPGPCNGGDVGTTVQNGTGGSILYYGTDYSLPPFCFEPTPKSPPPPKSPPLPPVSSPPPPVSSPPPPPVSSPPPPPVSSPPPPLVSASPPPPFQCRVKDCSGCDCDYKDGGSWKQIWKDGSYAWFYCTGTVQLPVCPSPPPAPKFPPPPPSPVPCRSKSTNYNDGGSWQDKWNFDSDHQGWYSWYCKGSTYIPECPSPPPAPKSSPPPASPPPPPACRSKSTNYNDGGSWQDKWNFDSDHQGWYSWYCKGSTYIPECPSPPPAPKSSPPPASPPPPPACRSKSTNYNDGGYWQDKWSFDNDHKGWYSWYCKGSTYVPECPSPPPQSSPPPPPASPPPPPITCLSSSYSNTDMGDWKWITISNSQQYRFCSKDGHQYPVCPSPPPSPPVCYCIWGWCWPSGCHN
eukprot:SM000226S07397  [mRNA]  locus=s226:76808:78978:+ [translate_table: standard]